LEDHKLLGRAEKRRELLELLNKLKLDIPNNDVIG
jgi:hypothetical protein